MTRIALTEAKRLVDQWSKGTFPSVSESIKYHFMRHGSEVSAKTVWQYLRKADGFARNPRGAKVHILENDASRYVKKGYYVIKDRSGKILSYGAE